MPRALRYSEQALANLDEISAWLTRPGSGAAARRRLLGIWTATERLRDYPCSGRVVDHPGVRELPCAGGYRVIYEVELDTGRNDDAGNVLVLKIYGPGQDRRDK